MVRAVDITPHNVESHPARVGRRAVRATPLVLPLVPHPVRRSPCRHTARTPTTNRCTSRDNVAA